MSEIQKTKNSKISILIKTIAIFAIIFSGFVGFRYYKIKAAHRSNSQAEMGKFDNIESEIFDLISDDKNHEDINFDEKKLSELTLTELKEGGAEFIYQLLLKNQIQISDLKNDVQNLKTDLAKYKSQERASKIIFTYVEMRRKFYAGEDYLQTSKSVEALAALDKDLQTKINILKQNLENFHGSKILAQDFSALIPDLIATKTSDPNASFIKKIRHNLSKLVVIRKLKPDTQSVDGIIKTTEDFLAQEDFVNALKSFELLEASYQEAGKGFLEKLKSAAQIQKTDQEILIYLHQTI